MVSDFVAMATIEHRKSNIKAAGIERCRTCSSYYQVQLPAAGEYHVHFTLSDPTL